MLAGLLTETFKQTAVETVNEAAEEKDLTVHNRAVNNAIDGGKRNTVAGGDMITGEAAVKNNSEAIKLKEKEEKEKSYKEALKDAVDQVLESVQKNIENIKRLKEELAEAKQDADESMKELQAEYGENLEGLVEEYGLREQKPGESEDDYNRFIIEQAAARGNEDAIGQLEKIRRVDKIQADIAAEQAALIGNMQKLGGQYDLLNVHLLTLSQAQVEIQAIKDIDDPASRDAAFQQWKEDNGAELGIEGDTTIEEAAAKVDQEVETAAQDVAVVGYQLEEAQSDVRAVRGSEDIEEDRASSDISRRERLLTEIDSASVNDDSNEVAFNSTTDDELVFEGELPIDIPISAASEVALGDEIGGEIPLVNQDFTVAASGKPSDEISVDAEVGNEISLTQNIPMKLG